MVKIATVLDLQGVSGYNSSTMLRLVRTGRRLIVSGDAQHRNDSDKKVYCVDEIAEVLCISRGAAYELVKKELFHTVRIGSAIRVSRKSFEEWLDNHKSNDKEA